MKKQLLLLVMILLPMVASADDSGSCGENLTWTYVESTCTLTISGTGEMSNYQDASIVPWYIYHSDIVKVVIEDGVTSIGSNAFNNCTNVVTVTIPNSVTSIGIYAFSGCMGLLSITLPNSLTTIGDYGFYNCSNLPTIIIPNGMSSINNWTFAGCSNMKSISIPNSVTSIGDFSFYSSGLTSLTIPSSVTAIGESAFLSCTGLTSVEIPESITTLSNNIFCSCTGLTTVTIPNSVTSIGQEAFSDCYVLSTITIPNSVTSIGANTFKRCYGLNSINIPNSVSSIGNCAFENCNGLTSVIISNSVTSIGESTFKGCRSLTSINIPNSVTVIGESAFQGCSDLASLTLSENLQIIKSSAFYNCLSLKTLTIPFAVEYIFQNAFNGCPLAIINAQPTTPPFIYNNTFSNYEAVVKVPNSCTTAYKEADNWKNFANISDKDYHQLTIKSEGKGAITYKGENLVNSSKTFYVEEGTDAELIITPDDWYQIATLTVNGVDAMDQLNNGVLTISNITAYTAVEVTFLEKCGLNLIWKYDPATHTLTISGSGGMSSYLYSNGDETPWIGFKDDIHKIIIEEGVINIGDRAFDECTRLSSVTIPNSCKDIGISAFHGCSALTSITIPKNVSIICLSSFSDCNNLKDVYCLPTNVPSIYDNGTGIFEIFSNPSEITLHVPSVSIEAYRSTYPWSAVGTIVSLDGNHYQLTIKSEGKGTITYKGEDLVNSSKIFYVEEGTDAELIITPDDWYQIATLTVNGVDAMDQLNNGVLTISNITANTTVTVTFTPTTYKLIYIVDDTEYKSYEIEFGATITPEPAPTKEGYTFSGWSEIPETMPAHDVTITGSFTINKYKLTYIVDDAEYKSYELEYGASITPEPAPTKEGYTFSGWSEIPETMPAHDVTVTGSFTINKYKLTYMIDDAEYKSYEIEFGATITPEPAPTKEGYTFSGWSEIPETMPAHDVTVTGSFTINKYKLIYMVDGAEYKSLVVEFGSTITPEPAPTKEGYTFSGWSEIPETMPAHDVTVKGTFAINKYKLTYVVDGEEYKSYEVEFGATITPEPAPTKEGYTFSGWSEIPATMPAHDVTVTGSFAVNQYTITYIIDNEVYTTQTVDYGSTIVPPTAPEHEGYDFAWGDYPETMPAYDITIYGTYTTDIEAIMAGEANCQIFSLDGKPLNELQKGVNIVRMGNGQVRKVVVK